MLNIERLAHGTKMVTRDGREVVDWHIVDNASETFFSVRARVKSADGKRIEELPYTRGGRRFINVRSEDDILVLESVKERRHRASEVRDTMPNPMKAIEAVRRHDIGAIRRANKDNVAATASAAVITYEIGAL